MKKAMHRHMWLIITNRLAHNFQLRSKILQNIASSFLPENPSSVHLTVSKMVGVRDVDAAKFINAYAQVS